MFGADIIMDFRKRSIGPEDPISKEEGVKIGVSIRKNHVVTNRCPYLKTEYYGIFGKGTEVYLEAIELAVEKGLIVKGGAFYKVPDENGNPVILEDGTKMQWQGTAKFRQYCIDNPDFFKDLTDKIGNDTAKKMSDEEIQAAIKEEQEVEEIIEEADILKEAKKSKKKK